MSRTAVQRRQEVRAALAQAFPSATWTVRRQTVKGCFHAITVSLDVAEVYGERGCSEVTAYRSHTDSTQAPLGQDLPRGSTPRQIVASVRRALRQVERLQAAIHAAVRLLEGGGA